MRRLLAAALVVGLTGCKTVEVDTDRPVDLLLQVSPSTLIDARVQGGDGRCTIRSTQPAALKAKPGTCLKAGDDGVLAPCGDGR